jgi:hypothetical protein
MRNLFRRSPSHQASPPMAVHLTTIDNSAVIVSPALSPLSVRDGCCSPRSKRRRTITVPAAISAIYFCVMVSLILSLRVVPAHDVIRLAPQKSPALEIDSFADVVAQWTAAPQSATADTIGSFPQLWKYVGTPETAWRCLGAISCNDTAVTASSRCSAGAEGWFRNGSPRSRSSVDGAQNSSHSVVLIPLAAWTVLWGAAWTTLSYSYPCRGSTFPLRAANEQFAASAYMGSATLQV